MTSQNQRISIAELCKWSGISNAGNIADSPFDLLGYDPLDPYCNVSLLGNPPIKKYVPDYLNDLNAISKAIQTLSQPDKKALRAIVWQLSDQMDPLPEASVFAKAFLMLKGIIVE